MRKRKRRDDIRCKRLRVRRQLAVVPTIYRYILLYSPRYYILFLSDNNIIIIYSRPPQCIIIIMVPIYYYIIQRSALNEYKYIALNIHLCNAGESAV